MKYLPLRDFGAITNALNFSTSDYHIIGGCDVYTTKAAGGDKKLYKQIEESLESQYESLVQLSASLSPPRRRASDGDKSGSQKRELRHTSVGAHDIFMNRNSPFGPLSKVSARRTFAYLIATLNASHPDYDFSYILQPNEFTKKRSLRGVMQNIDSTLLNLRPRSLAFPANDSFLSPPPTRSSLGLSLGGAEVWSPKMWERIDKEMGLRQCEIYTYEADEDPFDDEEGCIWSLKYLFYNKERKRVCYFYVRGFSVISHSPLHLPTYAVRRPAKRLRKASSVAVGDGAGKRASYWLGYGGCGALDTDSYGEDDDDEMIIAEPDDDEVEGGVPYMDLDDIRTDLADGGFGYEWEAEGGEGEEYWDETWQPRQKRGRGVSEEMVGRMEL